MTSATLDTAQAAPSRSMQLVLDEFESLNPLPIETLTPELARLIPLPDRAALAVYGHHFAKKALVPFPLPLGSVEHRLLPGAEGDLLARVYTPKGDAPEIGWPLLVYFHGGGWVIADLDTYDASCRALCDGAECVVVSVHYRQAPEHPWPAAPNDALAAFEWVRDHAATFAGDPARIAVAGESAGGNLAAVVCQMLRDKGIPGPVHQLLVYPVTDLAGGPDSPSAIENEEAKPLNRAMLGWFYGHYAPEPAQRGHPYASPLHAKSFVGLPPATVILAQIDPLRDDGQRYADRLGTSGVDVTVETFEGATHEFFGMAGLVHEATAAMALAAKNLRRAFGTA
ncbi:MAG TPA: alpha/beta hydrolase [Candidatus Methylacidiphilales bacterium]